MSCRSRATAIVSKTSARQESWRNGPLRKRRRQPAKKTHQLPITLQTGVSKFSCRCRHYLYQNSVAVDTHLQRDAQKRGEELGLSSEETAFYDALSENASAREAMQNDTLRLMARALTR